MQSQTVICCALLICLHTAAGASSWGKKKYVPIDSYDKYDKYDKYETYKGYDTYDLGLNKKGSSLSSYDLKSSKKSDYYYGDYDKQPVVYEEIFDDGDGYDDDYFVDSYYGSAPSLDSYEEVTEEEYDKNGKPHLVKKYLIDGSGHKRIVFDASKKSKSKY